MATISYQAHPALEGISINVVAYRSGPIWIGQGVEIDISARAMTLEGLPLAFHRAILANLYVNEKQGRSGLEGIPPAPDRFREFYESARDIPVSGNYRPIVTMRVAEAA